MFNKYYQDELSFLREMGAEFAKLHDKAAPFLGREGTDPDVERLLEGFAFLTGRIRQKLEDELPEVTHALMDLLWPHYLRPIPSMAILQFEALPQAAKEAHRVPRGTEVDSIPVDGTSCRFQTVYEVAMEPLVLERIEVKVSKPPLLRLNFRIPDGVSLQKVQIPSLRFHLQGEPAVTTALYLCLTRSVERVVLRAEGGGDRTVTLGPEAVRPAGFHPREALLPAPPVSFEGYRLFQEYFAFVTKFLFVDLTGLERLKELGDVKAFEVVFELKRLPEDMPALGTASILLNCTPIVNLFQHDADPIRIDHGKLQHRIRPGGGNSSHFEVHSVQKVTGFVKGAAASREYIPFFSFSHSLTPAGKDCAFYRTHLHGSLSGDGTDVFLSFVGSDGSAGTLPTEVETISIEILSSNRQLPSKLRLGDISAPTPTSPVFARFRNITMLTPSVPPPLGGDVYWKLIAHLGLNFRSLHHLDSLREVLRLYNFSALVDRQAEQACLRLLDGLKSIAVEPATRLLEGMPVRGVAINIAMEEDNFAGEGDMYLFASLLNEFFALYVTLNSFSQLTVKGLKHGEVYKWPPRIGDRSLF